MSETMRAVVLHGKEDARYEVVPLAPLAPGEVRIRVDAALTCGTDLKVFRRGYHARMIVPPSVFGHEVCGTIVGVGPGVTKWAPGQRVVAANSAPCGECFYCCNDREELCEDLLFWNGAYAEYATIPARIVAKNLLRVPDDLPSEAAALVEPLACAVHGVEETGAGAAETVLVIGAGPLGLLLVRCAVLAGAAVLVAGRGAGRLAAAAQMGAATAFDAGSGEDLPAWVRAQTEGRGADRVIEAVGRVETWEQAVAAVRKGGTINLFGGCPAGTVLTVDTARLHYDAITLLGTFHHTPATIRAALRLLEEGQIPWEVLIQERVSLEHFVERLPVLARGGGPLKVAVSPAAA